MTDEAKDRTKGIGGTDVAAIVGLSPYKTAYDVWLEKTGKIEPQMETSAMRMGTRLEPLVLKMLSEETGLTAQAGGRFVHPVRGWQVVNVDAVASIHDTILEAKTAGERQAHRWGEEGSDDIPPEYLTQVTWYMSALEWARAAVGVLIGGQEFRYYFVSLDPELERFLLAKAEEFWFVHVKGDKEPPIQTSTTLDRYLKQRFPRELYELRKASPFEIELLDGYAKARKDYDNVEAIKDRYEAELKLAIGDAAGIEYERGRITWRRAKDSSKVNWELVAKGFNPPPELVSLHTEIRPGSRRFLPKLQTL